MSSSRVTSREIALVAIALAAGLLFGTSLNSETASATTPRVIHEDDLSSNKADSLNIHSQNDINCATPLSREEVIRLRVEKRRIAHEMLRRNLRVMLTNTTFNLEGHSGQFEDQALTYERWMRTFPDEASPLVCETGFNAGHSAATFLSAHPRSRYKGFDMGEHSYSKPQMELLQETFGDRMLDVTWGDSTKTVPQFFKDNPDFKCDVLSVDGGHKPPVPKLDLENFAKLARSEHNMLLIDDMCVAEGKGSGCDCTAEWDAWNAVKEAGTIVQEECETLGPDRAEKCRGWCRGRYTV